MRFTLVAVVALAPACAIDDQVTDEEYADTALSLGSTTAHRGGEVAAMLDAVRIATGDLPQGFTRGADGAIRGHYFGLDYHYALICRDVSGARLATCDARTDSADVDAAWSGTLDLPQLAMALQRQGHWALTGIQGGVTRVTGDGHLGYDTASGNVSYRFAYDASYDVLVAAGATCGGWTHYGVNAERVVGSDDHGFTIDAGVKFRGTSAELVLDGDRRYTIDLATGMVSAGP